MSKTSSFRLSGPDNTFSKPGIPNRPVIHIALIVMLGLLAYSNTFHVPFQWDEKDHIEKNSMVKDLYYFLDPSAVKGNGRYIGYLTFALNYKIHGLDVTGYHIFNLAVHIFNALLVYFLVILTFRTPFLKGSLLKEHSKHIALFSALLFVSHPIQTEAVTYIFQRLASLMALFYLLSLVAYVGSGLSIRKTVRYTLYALSLVSAVLAMKTKENAFTLPFVMVLYEFLFFTGPKRRRILHLAPFLLTLLIIPLTLTGMTGPPGEIMGSMGSATRGYEAISRGDYLLTQFRVVATYIRFLFLPINQTLEYDYPVFRSFWNPQVFLSFFLLLSISGFAVYLIRSSKKDPAARLAAFGIFWFFITLSVESGIIPLHMVINEYRVYLPSAGAFTALTSGAFLLLGKLKNRKTKAIAVSAFIVIPLVLSSATYARNNVWGSEISLWEDVVRKSPQRASGHNNLAVVYASDGLTDKAVEHLQIALKLNPGFAEAHGNLGNAYFSKGLLDKAIDHYQLAVTINPDYVKAHISLGNVCKATGRIDKAIEHYRTALSITPDSAKVRYALGNAYNAKGLTDSAIEQYRTALKLKPDYADAHTHLGNAYNAKGLTDSAIEQYRTALRLKPDCADAHFNLGLTYFKKGVMNKARREFRMVLQINPDDAQTQQLFDSINKSWTP